MKTKFAVSVVLRIMSTLLMSGATFVCDTDSEFAEVLASVIKKAVEK